MSNITLTSDALRALIKVYKASLEISNTLQLSAIDVSDEGQPVWDESLDWPDLGICYFDLSKAISEAESKINVTQLERALDVSSVKSSDLNLIVNVKGQDADDLQQALQEVHRLIDNGFTSGFDCNETGSYRFSID